MDYTSLFSGPTATPQSLFGGMGSSPFSSLFGGGMNNPQMGQMAMRLMSMGGPQFLGAGGVSPASAMHSPMAAFNAASANPYGMALGRTLGPMNTQAFAPFRQMQQL